MLRPPSLQKSQDEFYSRDPAFRQLPADATPEQRAEHEHKWKVARETGRYDDLLIPGETATKFTMMPVNRTAWRAFIDRIYLSGDNPRRIGPSLAPQILFRLSVTAVAGFPDIQRRPHREWEGWDMAEESIVESLEAIDQGIITELGKVVFDRMSDIQKK